LKKMLIGLFMKVVVADRLAIYVDYVYAQVGIHGRLALLTAVFFYSFQLYCDFAGYSLIAIGAARTMGFSLSDNFKQPYLASSITQFWSRWHMTLSRWFRDYLYIPLGGSRVSTLRHLFNILVVFLLSGLWHGANWTFIVWGTLHGLLVIFETFFAGKRAARRNPISAGDRDPSPDRPARPFPSIGRIVGILYTFTLVSLCLVFFRSASVAEALTVIRRIFSPSTFSQTGGEFRERALLLYSLFGIGCILAMDIRMEMTGKRGLLLYHKRSTVRLSAVAALVVVILLLGVFDGSQFIYFQF
ncbi:MAG TPA: MBOAT family O-acyltransferase, partial [Puia sp.]|nr:MBOAT family O-acyltransferase [Puia sp.]